YPLGDNRQTQTSIQRLSNVCRVYTNLYPDTSIHQCCSSTPSRRISPITVPFAMDSHIAAAFVDIVLYLVSSRTKSDYEYRPHTYMSRKAPECVFIEPGICDDIVVSDRIRFDDTAFPPSPNRQILRSIESHVD
ncbi:unnamed protein product, partial [Timema podura]|nr:unnamed protein product [Timema podura]